MRDLSFLIGSGFSVPAGYPRTDELNQRLRKIDASEICIHTSGTAWFLGDQTDPNAWWMRREERQFVQEFLDFYNDRILGPNEIFHYEDFYDFYRTLLDESEHPKEIALFFDGHRARCGVESDNRNLIFRFNNTYNQLLAGLLSKNHELAHMGRAYPSHCAKFLDLSEELSKTHRIHYHSLNHDLYLEHLAYSDSIQNNMDDGFEELGSPYYGEIREKYNRYMVRLERFVDKYRNKFNLYKLHGSIDHYWFQTNRFREVIKVKSRVSPMELLMEVKDGEHLKYLRYGSNYHPDFLAGKTSKIRRYAEAEYYEKVFGHFEDNLCNSDSLIVIGYGFGDQKINEYIKNWLTSSAAKSTFVVGKSKRDHEILEMENVHFIGGGVENMDIEFILEKIKR